MLSLLRKFKTPFKSCLARDSKKKAKSIIQTVQEVRPEFHNPYILKQKVEYDKEFYLKMKTAQDFYTKISNVLLGIGVGLGFYLIFKGLWADYLTYEKIKFLSLYNKIIIGTAVFSVGVWTGLLFKTEMMATPAVLSQYLGFPTYFFIGGALAFLLLTLSSNEKNYNYAAYLNIGVSAILFCFGLFLVKAPNSGKLTTFFSNSLNSYISLSVALSLFILNMNLKEKRMQKEFVEEFKRRQDYVSKH